MTATRREILWGIAAAAASRGPAPGVAPLRYAICNETFQNLDFPAACRTARKAGYAGLEIAPATLGADPPAVTLAQRVELRMAMASEGLEYVGLHSLLTGPRGLHVTAADGATRRRSWDYLRRLVDLSGDLGGGVMVFGSGKQRAAAAGVTAEAAAGWFREGLAALAPAARERGVTILIEPLSPEFTNVVNTLAEAVAVVEAIAHPAVQTMFDTHNGVAEKLPHGELIKKYRRHIRHIHVNEMDGRHPGAGNYDFAELLRALREITYRGWISVEVFDFSPGGERIAEEAMRRLRRAESQSR